ncbi:hypothetical protein JWG42_11835 [Desulfoprunum benzoelyticum]|uniref:Uncharacterized protein n=1 Tax=Desulfoprunum benzoelyticum TaxID=1506996 RepID=A0A840V323_9BACT|nr:hypothetical protein [Desulfoprunum benzoelyticum]MBB5349228.1 hypothetical protein [Desulfoprunum benzoelyticum]MBM9530841.1 hypothetical protein [Desulfoprunum benzoelyticum]
MYDATCHGTSGLVSLITARLSILFRWSEKNPEFQRSVKGLRLIAEDRQRFAVAHVRQYCIIEVLIHMV